MRLLSREGRRTLGLNLSIEGWAAYYRTQVRARRL
jgi:hypothetical protein